MHTKVQHLQTLIEWLLTRDREFVSMINSRLRLSGMHAKTIAAKLNLTLDQWSNWLALKDIQTDRSAVDTEIRHLIVALTQTRMGGGGNDDDDDDDTRLAHHNSHHSNGGGDNNHSGGDLEHNDDDIPNNNMDRHFTPIAGVNNTNVQSKSLLVQNAFPSLPRNMLRSVVRIIGDLSTRKYNPEDDDIDDIVNAAAATAAGTTTTTMTTTTAAAAGAGDDGDGGDDNNVNTNTDGSGGKDNGGEDNGEEDSATTRTTTTTTTAKAINQRTTRGGAKSKS